MRSKNSGMPQERRPKRNILPIALRIAAIVLILAGIGVAVARYLYREESDSPVKAKEFYFTSSLLDGGTHTFSPGTESVTFTLTNHADALRYSEMPIAYTVTVSPSAEIVGGAGTLAGGVISDTVVTVSNLQPGISYTVTASADGGYHQILSATVVVSEPVLYKHLDTTNSEYVLLTVWSQGYLGDVTITAPGTVIPDNTDEVMRTAQTGDPFTDSVSFQSSRYCSHTYRFFGQGVTAEQFSVIYHEDQEAQIRTPV